MKIDYIYLKKRSYDYLKNVFLFYKFTKIIEIFRFINDILFKYMLKFFLILIENSMFTYFIIKTYY